jgi:hypothetical protein
MGLSVAALSAETITAGPWTSGCSSSKENVERAAIASSTGTAIESPNNNGEERRAATTSSQLIRLSSDSLRTEIDKFATTLSEPNISQSWKLSFSICFSVTKKKCFFLGPRLYFHLSEFFFSTYLFNPIKALRRSITFVSLL